MAYFKKRVQIFSNLPDYLRGDFFKTSDKNHKTEFEKALDEYILVCNIVLLLNIVL